MSSQVFQVVVTDALGKVKVKTATIGGGAMTAAGLAEHYEKLNAFPGAKSVEITELDGTVVPPKLEELQRIANQRRDTSSQFKPLTTPKPEIKPKYVLPEDQRPKRQSMPGQVPLSGDGLGNLPASPVNSPTANAARETFDAAQKAAGGSSGEDPTVSGSQKPPKGSSGTGAASSGSGS